MMITNIMSFTTKASVLIILCSRGANSNAKRITKTLECKRGDQQFTLYDSDSIELFINTRKLTTKNCLVNVKHVSKDGPSLPIRWKVVEYKVQKKCPIKNCYCQPLLYVADDKVTEFYTIGRFLFRYLECWFDRNLLSYDERLVGAGDSGIGRNAFGITIIVEQLHTFNLDAVITFSTKDDTATEDESDASETAEKLSVGSTIAIVVPVICVVIAIAVIAYIKIRGPQRQRAIAAANTPQIVGADQHPHAQCPQDPPVEKLPGYPPRGPPEGSSYPPQGQLPGYLPQEPPAGQPPEYTPHDPIEEQPPVYIS